MKQKPPCLWKSPHTLVLQLLAEVSKNQKNYIGRVEKDQENSRLNIPLNGYPRRIRAGIGKRLVKLSQSLS